jgi:hypothetical protein
MVRNLYTNPDHCQNHHILLKHQQPRPVYQLQEPTHQGSQKNYPGKKSRREGLKDYASGAMRNLPRVIDVKNQKLSRSNPSCPRKCTRKWKS